MLMGIRDIVRITSKWTCGSACHDGSWALADLDTLAHGAGVKGRCGHLAAKRGFEFSFVVMRSTEKRMVILVLYR